MKDLIKKAEKYVLGRGYKGIANHTVLPTLMAEFAKEYCEGQISKEEMKTEKLGNEPVYPTTNRIDDGKIVEMYQVGDFGEHRFKGMSKRFYAATAILAALLSSDNSRAIYHDGKKTVSKEDYVSLSYVMADELLLQENK